MSKLFCKFSLFIFLCTLTITTFAWNALGHKVIGNIAYRSLTPEARKKVDLLISYFQNEYPQIQNLDQLAQWPDTLYAQRIFAFSHWHYINMPFSKEGSIPYGNYILSDNAVWVLKNVTGVIRNEKANVYERARFLAFYTHIISDLHQPLHTVSLISKRYPNGDKGGNLYFVRVHNDRVKLHKLWDQGCGVFSGASSQSHVDSVATSIMQSYPLTSLTTKSKDFSFDNWLKEGMKSSQEIAYSVPEETTVSNDYIKQCRHTAEEAAALAGYRIAGLLNDMFS